MIATSDGQKLTKKLQTNNKNILLCTEK